MGPLLRVRGLNSEFIHEKGINAWPFKCVSKNEHSKGMNFSVWRRSGWSNRIAGSKLVNLAIPVDFDSRPLSVGFNRKTSICMHGDSRTVGDLGNLDVCKK